MPSPSGEGLPEDDRPFLAPHPAISAGCGGRMSAGVVLGSRARHRLALQPGFKIAPNPFSDNDQDRQHYEDRSDHSACAHKPLSFSSVEAMGFLATKVPALGAPARRTTMNNHPKAILRIVKLVALLSPLLLAGCGEN